VAGTPAVVSEITGRAWMTARSTLVFDRTGLPALAGR
jgi:proline racemase